MDPLQFLEDRLSSFPFTTLPFTYPTRLGINVAQQFMGSGKSSPEQQPQQKAAPPEPKQPTTDSSATTDEERDTPAGPEVSPPEGGPALEGEGAKQEQEPITSEVLKRLDLYADPAYQQEISKIKTRNLIEAASVLSALRAPRERQKQAAEIERQNIQAWRDIKAAQIEANARQQMALGLATVSAMTPNLSNFAEIYKASTAPFNIRPRG